MELSNPHNWSSDLPDDMTDLESHLASSFHPVHPNPEFVHTLKGRLLSSPAIVIENRERLLKFYPCSGSSWPDLRSSPGHCAWATKCSCGSA
jgi:hypothetical protein